MQVIKNELKTCSTFTQNDFVFNSSTTSASEEDDKISINFGQKSASKGWLLTLPTDTTEVRIHLLARFDCSYILN